LPTRLRRPVATCFSRRQSNNFNNLVLIPSRLARDKCGRFVKGSSGNPRGRPRGIPNPKRRVPDLATRPLTAQALSDLIDRKPHLLRPLAAQLLPPPLAIDPAERLGIDLSSLRTERISSGADQRSDQRSRAARSRPPKAHRSLSGSMPGYARAGASHGRCAGRPFKRVRAGRIP
jgi:hypothetical protein